MSIPTLTGITDFGIDANSDFQSGELPSFSGTQTAVVWSLVKATAGGDVTIADSAGGSWTGPLIEEEVDSGNANQRTELRVWWRQVTAGDDTEATVTLTAAAAGAQLGGGVMVVDGADPSDPIGASASTSSTSVDLSTCPALTLDGVESLIVHIAGVNPGAEGAASSVTWSSATNEADGFESIAALGYAVATQSTGDGTNPSAETADFGYTAERHLGASIEVKAATTSVVSVTVPSPRIYFAAQVPTVTSTAPTSAPPSTPLLADVAAVSPPTVRILVRDDSLNRVAELDDYLSLVAIRRFRGVGSWVLTVDPSVSAVSTLQTIGNAKGVEVHLDGAPWLTGRLGSVTREWDSRRGREVLTLAGPDDNAVMRDRVIVPNPSAAAPPYQDDYWVAEGDAGEVVRDLVDAHIGSAANAVRQVSGLTVAAAPTSGTNIDVQFRFAPLWDTVAELCLAYGLGVRTVGTAGAYTVTVSAQSASDVIFSRALGNLTSYRVSLKAPTATRVLGLGQGELAAREVVEVSDNTAAATYGRREIARDARQADTTAQLTDSATQELSAAQATVSARAQVIDRRPFVYGTDYDLGSVVTAVVGDVSVAAPVAEVRLTATAADSVTLEPVVGELVAPEVEVFSKVDHLATRLARLEGAQ